MVQFDGAGSNGQAETGANAAAAVGAPEALEDDALLDIDVAAALENCRAADAAAVKTAEEWERDKAREFLALTPDTLRSFATEALPETALQLNGNALGVELFSSSDMPHSLRPLSKNATRTWSSAIAGAPPMPAMSDTSLPDAIPDTEGLRRYLLNIERAIRFVRYRAVNAEFIKQAMKRTLAEAHDLEKPPAAEMPLREQLAALKRFAQSSTSFRVARHQQEQIESTCKVWAGKRERITKLARAAAAIEPFKTLPTVIQEQVGGLIGHLNTRATQWADSIYRAPCNGAPSYAGIDPADTDTFTLLAANGKHRVAAHHIMNSSALRAFLWAFVLALWEKIWNKSGGISCLLMDDAQDLLDPANVANMAAAIPKMLEAGMAPLIASNDFGFLASVENHVKAASGSGSPYCVEAWELSAISQSKPNMTRAPLIDEVQKRFRLWEKNNNDPALSREFVNPVRARIENKLWDLLGNDFVVLQKPTLNDLIARISWSRNNGARPFNEEPFRNLVEMPCLQPGAQFRDIISKPCHGQADQVTPTEAGVVAKHHAAVLTAIEACWVTYAREMRRLPSENGLTAGTETPPAPVSIPFIRSAFPMIGDMAAHGAGTALVDIDATTSSFRLDDLGEMALYTLRANTLGMIALQGQTLIVSLTEEPRHGDFAVILTTGRVYARRIGMDQRNPSRIALETLQSITNVPPTHFVKRSAARLLKVIGVLFDDAQPSRSKDEAVSTDTSPILAQVTAAPASSVTAHSPWPRMATMSLSAHRGH